MGVVRFPVFTLRPYERGIRESLGRYDEFVLPGLGLQLPLIQLVRIRDVREHTMDIQPQSVITKDNVEIKVDGVCGCARRPMRSRSSARSTASTTGSGR